MYFRPPSLKALRTFEAVVRLGSLTEAAHALHVSPGAISHQIKALEQQLGLQLFERSTGALVPTIAAIELAERVRGGLDLIFGGVRRLRLGGGSSSLSIGCDVTFGISWLGPRIGRFMERYPEIEVAMDLADPGPDPTWQTVDATIHFGYGRFPKYETIRLTTESLSPVCAPTYLSSSSPATSIRSPADLLRCSLLHVPWLEPDTLFGTLTWRTWFAQAGVETHGVKLSGVQSGSVIASAVGKSVARQGQNGQTANPCAAFKPAIVRSRFRLRSNSASAQTCGTPAGPVEERVSIRSVRDAKARPRFCRCDPDGRAPEDQGAFTARRPAQMRNGADLHSVRA